MLKRHLHAEAVNTHPTQLPIRDNIIRPVMSIINFMVILTLRSRGTWHF